jgi:hypothetical protein
MFMHTTSRDLINGIPKNEDGEHALIIRDDKGQEIYLFLDDKAADTVIKLLQWSIEGIYPSGWKGN